MSPRRRTVEPTKGVFHVEWPLFGELARGLGLTVSRAYDPDVVIGIATAGVVPGAVIAAMLRREFHSVTASRKYRPPDADGNTPAIFGQVPARVRGRKVLVVDETCDTGDTLRLVTAAVVNAGATDVRTAVGFRTGPYAPDFHALETDSVIVLPWDREVIVEGRLQANPEFADALEAADFDRDD